MNVYLFALLCVELSHSYPSGPPNTVASVCQELKPSGAAPHILQQGAGGYTFQTSVPASTTSGYLAYNSNQVYNITATGTQSNPISGILVQAWDPSNARIGTFIVSEGLKLLDCSQHGNIAAAATLSHDRKNTQPSISFNWNATSGGDGMVDFRITIVSARDKYYGPLSVASNGVPVTSPGTTQAVLSTSQPAQLGAQKAKDSLIIGVISLLLAIIIF